MNYILFIITYLLGFIPMFIENEYSFYYFLLIILYVSLFNTIKPEAFKINVLHPMILSTISIFMIFIVHGYGIYKEIWFAMPLIFIYLAYRMKMVNNDNNELFLIEYFMMPLALPISLCFILALMIKNEMLSLYMYVSAITLLYIYLLKVIPTKIYTILSIIAFNLINIYLYKYMIFMDFEKFIYYLIMVNLLLSGNFVKSFLKEKTKDKKLKKEIQ